MTQVSNVKFGMFIPVGKLLTFQRPLTFKTEASEMGEDKRD